jgi:deoxyribose-phosphate aldolase
MALKPYVSIREMLPISPASFRVAAWLSARWWGFRSVAEGAAELDMVLNIGALKSGDLKTVEADIKAVRKVAESQIVLKVIIETGLLTTDEKIKACEITKNAGADFVKTSTGFSGGGATVEDVALMREVVGQKMGVKASGGIKDWSTAVAMVKAGANRIGTSSGIVIVENAPDWNKS